MIKNLYLFEIKKNDNKILCFKKNNCLVAAR